MDKLKITRNEAEREAANQGLTIPENEFTVKKSHRGRPKKTTIANDTSGSDDDNESVKKSEPPKKERGRPYLSVLTYSLPAAQNEQSTEAAAFSC